MKFLYLFISSVILAYSVILVFTYFYQRNLLYHPSENNYLNEKIFFDYEEFLISVDDDIDLKSWFIKKNVNKYKTILFFHGNAGNLYNRVYKLNKLNELNVNVLIISWRGFSGNKGSPTEKNLYSDAKKAVKWLNENGINNENIVLYGESLGTGVAVELAQNKKFNSIILESPFTSIANAAKIYYPYLPIELLIKDRYDSINKIKNIKVPIMIMHGKKDDIVPQSMGKELYKKANDPKYSYFPEDDNHMLEFNEELLKNVKIFLEKNNF